MACDKSSGNTYCRRMAFFQTMVQYLSKGQQFANLRKGKLLRETCQLDYVSILKWPPEGWKYILTGVETME